MDWLTVVLISIYGLIFAGAHWVDTNWAQELKPKDTK